MILIHDYEVDNVVVSFLTGLLSPVYSLTVLLDCIPWLVACF